MTRHRSGHGLCVATILEGEDGRHIRDLRRDVRAAVGLAADDHAAPHLSIVVLRARPSPAEIEGAVRGVAAGAAPFALSGAGYGVFVGRSGDAPVIHLALTKTPALAALHAAMVDAVVRLGAQVDGQYDLEHWRPHVTLAEIAGADDVGTVMSVLVRRRPRHWTLTIDNLALLAPDAPPVRHPFARAS